MEDIKVLFTATEINEAEIRLLNREYNPREWDRKIDKYMNYKPTFYVVPKGEGFSYDRYYVKYQIDTGIIFFKSLSYSSCVSDRGFCRIGIASNGEVRRFLLQSGNVYGRAENTKENREQLEKLSLEHGFIWSNEF